MKRLTADILAALRAAAAASPRRRKNFNLHASSDDPIQRLCNAFEPGTYVRPHRHGADVWELFLVLGGRAVALTFDDHGTVTARTELQPGGEVQAVELPPGAWHSIVSLAPGTVLFEVKPGPYRPTGENDFAAWAPPEGAAVSGAFVEWMARAAIGARPPAMA
jgi:cupin fold WbuC family metalloprotein